MALPLKYNFRNLWVRQVSTLMTIAGIAMVVAVFVIVSSLAQGLRASFVRTGDPLTTLVLRKGSARELQSFVTLDAYDILRNMEGVTRDQDGPVASGETFTVVVAPRMDGSSTNLTVRGVSPKGIALRPNFHISEGRLFRPGLAEVVVSRNLSGRFLNSRLGDPLDINDRDFEVVGIFETGGTAYDSEVWGDVDVLAETFRRRGGFSSVRLRATSAEAGRRLQEQIEADPRLTADAVAETDYYASQTSVAMPIMIIGGVVSVLLGIGAVFGAMNTLYAAVATRVREIAMLRALGFSRFSVVVAFLIEALLLALMGGIAGCLLAIPFNGLATGTMNWFTFSEAAFAFEISIGLLLFGIAFALVMGFVGGLPPAFRAARRPIASTLREL